MISKALQKGINAQVGNELFACNQYVQIAVYFDGEALPQLAAHYYRQADEERAHSMKFVKYLVDAGGEVAIPAVPAPKATITSALEAVQMAQQNEQRVTAQINALMDQAVKDKDHMAQQELAWFVNEQREEEASADTLVRMVKRAGEAGLFHVEAFLKDGGLAEAAGAGEAD